MEIKAKDLAKLLNISPSTVSLVLNNKPGISKATREKVIKAVKELGYENMIVKEDNANKKILFVVYRKNGISSVSTPYFSQVFSEVIEGVEAQVKIRGYQLMISYVDKESLKEESKKIKNENISGVIILATEMEQNQILRFTDNIEKPIVILDNYVEKAEVDCITINNEQGVYEAIEHFAHCGHKRVGYIHINKSVNNFSERYFGFLRAMMLFEFETYKEDTIEITTGGGEEVYTELKEKLEEKLKLKKDLPTAFFADNDIVAIYAIRAFKELGYKVPEDISIIGFDNMPLSEILDPPLTTIQIPRHKLGIVTVNSIIDRIKCNSKGMVKIEVGTKLVIRKSVKNIKGEG